MNFTKEQLEFIDKAMQSISDDPKTRISELVKDVIEEDNYVFDAHCHVFDGECINLKYMATRMIVGAVGRFRSLVWRLITGERYSSENFMMSSEQMVEMVYEDKIPIPDINLTSALNRMEKELDQIEMEIDIIELETLSFSAIAFDYREFFRRYKRIIGLLRTGEMEDVYNTFEKEFAIHRVINNKNGGNKKLLTITLGMDLNSGWQGKVKKTWLKQNNDLALLSKKYPILPYLPIDPRRTDLYSVFLNVFDKANPQFFGVKCYPALGYLPADERLMPIFKICEEKNIPVMTHCGGEIVSTFEKTIHANRLGVKVVINDRKRTDRARKLNEPDEWEHVLKEFKNLRLCLGHFGSASAWENDPQTAHRIPKILDMMARYDNLYADFSFNLESITAIKNFRDKLYKNDAEGEIMQKRCMFGTDFWVILPISDLIKDQMNFIEETEELLNELLKTNVLNYLKLS